LQYKSGQQQLQLQQQLLQQHVANSSPLQHLSNLFGQHLPTHSLQHLIAAEYWQQQQQQPAATIKSEPTTQSVAATSVFSFTPQQHVNFAASLVALQQNDALPEATMATATATPTPATTASGAATAAAVATSPAAATTLKAPTATQAAATMDDIDDDDDDSNNGGHMQNAGGKFDVL